VGIGLSARDSALAYWPFAATAIVRLNHDGTVTLYNGAVEFGQGADTIACQIVAEELGLEVGDVTLVSNDSELCPMDFNNWLNSSAKVTN
jgi:CO/xanthine dehydrogenase Mo-binding subunit